MFIKNPSCIATSADVELKSTPEMIIHTPGWFPPTYKTTYTVISLPNKNIVNNAHI